MDAWPAMNDKKWNIDYIMRVARARLVPVEIGSKYTDASWSQKLMTIGQFVEKLDKLFIIFFISSFKSVKKIKFNDLPFHFFQFQFCSYVTNPSSSRKAYLAQHQLFDQIHEFRRDILVPDYCAVDSDRNDVEINAWFGPGKTISPLHRDQKENLFCQVRLL